MTKAVQNNLLDPDTDIVKPIAVIASSTKHTTHEAVRGEPNNPIKTQLRQPVRASNTRTNPPRQSQHHEDQLTVSQEKSFDFIAIKKHLNDIWLTLKNATLSKAVLQRVAPILLQVEHMLQTSKPLIDQIQRILKNRSANKQLRTQAYLYLFEIYQVKRLMSKIREFISENTSQQELALRDQAYRKTLAYTHLSHTADLLFTVADSRALQCAAGQLAKLNELTRKINRSIDLFYHDHTPPVMHKLNPETTESEFDVRAFDESCILTSHAHLRELLSDIQIDIDNISTAPNTLSLDIRSFCMLSMRMQNKYVLTQSRAIILNFLDAYQRMLAVLIELNPFEEDQVYVEQQCSAAQKFINRSRTACEYYFRRNAVQLKHQLSSNSRHNVYQQATSTQAAAQSSSSTETNNETISTDLYAAYEQCYR